PKQRQRTWPPPGARQCSQPSPELKYVRDTRSPASRKRSHVGQFTCANDIAKSIGSSRKRFGRNGNACVALSFGITRSRGITRAPRNTRGRTLTGARAFAQHVTDRERIAGS